MLYVLPPVAAGHSGMDLSKAKQILLVEREALKAGYDAAVGRYGSFEAYAEAALGVDAAGRAALRGALLAR